MKWRRGKRSGDLRDRRAGGGGAGGLGGGRLPFPLPLPGGRMGGGIGTIVLLVVAYLLFGRGLSCGESGFDITDIISPPQVQVPASGEGKSSVPGGPDPEAGLVDFVSFVLDDTQSLWAKEFDRTGRQYQRAELVLFRDATRSGCGSASSATGPFYCPLDQTAYMDLGFFIELNRRFMAPGDFAQAYVIAHEIGHHVQQELGIERQVREESAANPDDANELSVRLELQADCFAGVWARSTYERGILQRGDLEEGLAAAAAVGDDRIQEQTSGRIDPETWTHGSAEQRSAWLQRGFDSGDIEACDTFSAEI